MLSPTFGPMKYKNTKGENVEKACNARLLKTLKQEGISTFKTIFDKGHKNALTKFFENSVIQAFWPTILKHSKEIHYFKKDGTQSIKDTMKQITYDVENIYGLEVPAFWKRRFPPTNFRTGKGVVRRRH